ncbi:MAG: hypothetical protein WCO60_20260, partial [Verrucomicrobiota bacterium]
MNRSKGLFSGSINREFALPLLLAGVLGGACAFLMIPERSEQIAVQKLEERAQLLANTLGVAAEIISVPGNLQRVVASAGADPGVLEILVAAGSPNRIVASSQFRFLDKPLSAIPAEEYAEDLLKAMRTRK